MVDKEKSEIEKQKKTVKYDGYFSLDYDQIEITLLFHFRAHSGPS